MSGHQSQYGSGDDRREREIGKLRTWEQKIGRFQSRVLRSQFCFCAKFMSHAHGNALPWFHSSNVQSQQMFRQIFGDRPDRIEVFNFLILLVFFSGTCC